MRSNCLIFALWMWVKQPRSSYVSWRLSHYYRGPHFLWTKRYRSGRFVMLAMVPEGRNADGSWTGKPAPKIRRWFPPVLFRGVLVRGDERKE